MGERFIFPIADIMFPRVFEPELDGIGRWERDRGESPSRARWGLAFPEEYLITPLRTFAKVYPERTVESPRIRKPLPARVQASTHFEPALVPDDLVAFRKLKWDAVDYRVPLDRLLHGASAEVAITGWESSYPMRHYRERHSGLCLLALKFEVAPLTARLKYLVEHPEVSPWE